MTTLLPELPPCAAAGRMQYAPTGPAWVANVRGCNRALETDVGGTQPRRPSLQSCTGVCDTPGRPQAALAGHHDTRTNIPTEELREFVADDERAPKTLLYPRDPSLDPQLVWKGKMNI